MKPAKLMTVTPGMALEWIQRRAPNRSVRPVAVKQLRREMDNGTFHAEVSTIKFNRKGFLVDGQTRLYALIAHGKPVEMYVQEDFSDEAIDVVDTGSRRSFADQLTRYGEHNTTLLAACTGWAARILESQRSGQPNAVTSQSYGFSHRELTEVLAKNHSIRAAVDWAKRAGPELRTLCMPSVLAAAFWWLGTIDGKDRDVFMEQVANGLGHTQKGNPIQTLRRRLAHDTRRGGAGRLGAAVQLAFIVKAWNAMRRRESLVALKWTMGEDFPWPI